MGTSVSGKWLPIRLPGAMVVAGLSAFAAITPRPVCAATPDALFHPAVVEICLESKRPPVMCECAAKRIAVSHPEAHQDYADVANTYLSNRRDGMRRREAWAAAIAARAANSGRDATTFGAAIDATASDHQLAMHACGQSG